MSVHHWRPELFRPALLSRLVLLALMIVLLGAGSVHSASIPLPVPKVTLYPGDSIRADHLVERTFNVRLTQEGAVHRTQDRLIGKVVRRTLLPGKPIPINAVREPFLVVQGHIIQIVFQDGPLIITGYAVALQSGGNGDVVRVRNADSGVIVSGAIQPDGAVKVGTP